MIIDCDTCAERGPACADCLVTVLLGGPPAQAGDGLDLDGAEQAAIAVLADSGLVPPLRLLPLSAVRCPGPRGGGERAAAPAGPPETVAHTVTGGAASPCRSRQRREAG